jgi:hypothetical protein
VWSLIVTQFAKPVLLTTYNVFDLISMHPNKRFRALR